MCTYTYFLKKSQKILKVTTIKKHGKEKVFATRGQESWGIDALSLGTRYQLWDLVCLALGRFENWEQDTHGILWSWLSRRKARGKENAAEERWRDRASSALGFQQEVNGEKALYSHRTMRENRDYSHKYKTRDIFLYIILIFLYSILKSP